MMKTRVLEESVKCLLKWLRMEAGGARGEKVSETSQLKSSVNSKDRWTGGEEKLETLK